MSPASPGSIDAVVQEEIGQSVNRSPGLVHRRWPIGAEPVAPDRTDFRVWAPQRQRVEVVLEGGDSVRGFHLAAEGNGYFSGTIGGAAWGVAIAFASTARSVSIPIPPRGSSRRGRTARRR